MIRAACARAPSCWPRCSCWWALAAVVYNLVPAANRASTTNWHARAANQQLADETITPNRGVIYDADMKVLAQQRHGVDGGRLAPGHGQKAGTNINDVAVKLAELLELDAQSVLEKLSEERKQLIRLIKRQVEKPVADAITAWITEYNASDKGKDTPVAGISLVQDAKRYYPYGRRWPPRSSALSNADGDGVLGIESLLQRYAQGHRRAAVVGHEERLRGTMCRTAPTRRLYDAAGRQRPGADASNASIQQHIGKSTCRTAVDQYTCAKTARVGIVMDVNTGAILAMATMPDYDLQRPVTPSADEALAARDRRPLRMTSERGATARVYPRSAAQVAQQGGGRPVLPRARCSRSSRPRPRWTPAPANAEHLVHLHRLHHRGGPHHALRRTPSGTARWTSSAAWTARATPTMSTLAADDGRGDVLQLYAGLRLLRENGRRHGRRGARHSTSRWKAWGPVELASCRLRPDDVHHAHPDDHCGLRRHRTAAYLVQPHVVKQSAGRGREYRGKRGAGSQAAGALGRGASATMRELLTRSVSMTAADGKTLTGGNKTGYVAGYKAGGKSGTSQQQAGAEGRRADATISSYCGLRARRTTRRSRCW